MPNDFFKEMQEWSARKHDLLQKYPGGFIRILGSSYGLVYYVDGFAGRGKYESGQPGSPVLAAQLAASQQYHLQCINVELDADNFENLKENCLPYDNYVTCKQGAFGDHIDEIIRYIGNQPAIFFLDPFGIKGIEWRHISKIASRQPITEILIRISELDLQRLAGHDDSDVANAEAKVQLVTDLLGFQDASGWQEEWKQNGAAGLVRLYMTRLRNAMGARYVFSYPIKSIEGDVKYHLIFATRNIAGALLMSDTVCNREKDYRQEVAAYKTNQPEQFTLFPEDREPTEDELIDIRVKTLCDDIYSMFKNKRAGRGEIREAMLSKWFGLVNNSYFTKAINLMLDDGRIVQKDGNASDDKSLLAFA